MVSINLVCIVIPCVSVIVRFKLVGREAGGEVSAVVALSPVGVRLDSSDPIFSCNLEGWSGITLAFGASN